jgi:hypothetical protein
MRKFRVRPYYGVRINRRGLRPYAGIGCALPLIVLLLAVAFAGL